MKSKYIHELIKLGKDILPEFNWLIDEGDQNLSQKTINNVLDMIEDKRFLHTDFQFEEMIDTHDRYLKFEEMSKQDKREVKKAEKKYGMKYEEMMKRAILYQLSYSNFLCIKESDGFDDESLEEQAKCVEDYKGDINKSFFALSPYLTHMPYKTLIFDFSNNEIETLKNEHGCYLVSSFYHNRDKNCTRQNKAYICISNLDRDKLAIKDINLGVFLEIDWYDYNPIVVDYDIGVKAGISKEAIYTIFRYITIQSYKASDMNFIDSIADCSGYRRKRWVSRKCKTVTQEECNLNLDDIITKRPLKQRRKPTQNYDYQPTLDDDYEDKESKPYKDNIVRAHCQRYWKGSGDNKVCVVVPKSEYARGTKKRDNRAFVYRTETNINPEDAILIDEHGVVKTE